MIPGKGFQYTPKKNVQWADDFNKLLNNYSSRNDLISKLIEDGLAVQNGSRHKGKGIYISLDNFSDEQLLILNSPDGQKILNNLISSMLGIPSNASFVTQLSTVQDSNETASDEKEEPKKAPTNKTVDEREPMKKEVIVSKSSRAVSKEYYDDNDGINALDELMKDASLTDL